MRRTKPEPLRAQTILLVGDVEMDTKCARSTLTIISADSWVAAKKILDNVKNSEQGEQKLNGVITSLFIPEIGNRSGERIGPVGRGIVNAIVRILRDRSKTSRIDIDKISKYPYAPLGTRVIGAAVRLGLPCAIVLYGNYENLVEFYRLIIGFIE